MSDAQDKPVIEQDDSAKENKAQSAEGVFAVPPAPKDAIDTEKAEEAKLTAKYPDLKKRAGKSALVQKRLSKGTRYFDSGDYNMAKSKMAPGKSPFSIVPPSATGGVPPPSALAAGKSQQPAPAVLPAGSTGEEIPTPQTIQQCRKPSIVSKLAADHLLQ